jgi:hypothetical protein
VRLAGHPAVPVQIGLAGLNASNKVICKNGAAVLADDPFSLEGVLEGIGGGKHDPTLPLELLPDVQAFFTLGDQALGEGRGAGKSAFLPEGCRQVLDEQGLC